MTCSAARLPLQPLARESCCMAAVPQVVWHNPQRIPLHACGRHACCVATRMTTECEATITPMRICFTPTQNCSRPRTHPCLGPSAQLNDHARRATERDHCAYIDPNANPLSSTNTHMLKPNCANEQSRPSAQLNATIAHIFEPHAKLLAPMTTPMLMPQCAPEQSRPSAYNLPHAKLLAPVTLPMLTPKRD